MGQMKNFFASRWGIIGLLVCLFIGFTMRNRA